MEVKDRESNEIVFEGETRLDSQQLYLYQVTLDECRAAPKWSPDQLTPPPLALFDAMKIAKAHLSKNIEDLDRIEFNDFKLTMLDSEESSDTDAQWGMDQFWGWIIRFSNNKPRTGTGLNPSIEVIVLMDGFCPSYQAIEE